MTSRTLYVGSLEILKESVARAGFTLPDEADVVIVPTAAAFTGTTAATLAVTDALSGLALRLEGLMVSDRQSANEEYFPRRISEADLVVLCDGAPLHARTTWRDTHVGRSLLDATQVVSVGAMGSILGATMIDPRGGAPTTGLGTTTGLIVASRSSDEQLARTRSLLGPEDTLVVLAPGDAMVATTSWWRLGGTPEASRGGETTLLADDSIE